MPVASALHFREDLQLGIAVLPREWTPGAFPSVSSSVVFDGRRSQFLTAPTVKASNHVSLAVEPLRLSSLCLVKRWTTLSDFNLHDGSAFPYA
eukprot:981229-Amphidinium_carterae.2